MNKNGFIYPTVEINSDGSELLHNGKKKMGFGRSNDPNRRFKEHAARGSKATVGVKFLNPIDCDEIGISDIELENKVHKYIEILGFDNIDRVSIYEKEGKKVISTTEVFSGVSNKNIPNIVSVGEELSEDLFKRIVSNLSNVDLFKVELKLFPHQLKTKKIITDKFDAGVKEILLNHKPRSGKSFICYDYIINNQPNNVLLLTQYPILNEQWKYEFKNLRGHDYNIIISRDVDKIILDKDKPNFVMISLQDAKGSGDTDAEIVEGLMKQKFSEIIKTNWDLIIFDEVHKGKETAKTDKLLSGLNYDKLIGLTATATKNILRGSFTLDNIDRYTLTEENEYKKLYPDIYKNPSINHLLFNVDEEVKKEMEFFKTDDGFTFNKFFEVRDNLVYRNDIIKLFNWFFCKGRYNKKSNATFDVINKCQSILLFVDNNDCQSYIRDILNDILGDIYDIYFTNSDVMSSSQLYKKIKKGEYESKNGKKVIVIANRQLTTGVTLPSCDMVIFMNDWKSIDEYIQASYRCQSPNDNKDNCYVVDLNPSRAFAILHSYIESNSMYKKDDINKSIREYLNCAPIYESFGNELKKIDFEDFKNRVVEFSGIENKFFPISIMNSNEDIIGEQDRLLSFGILSRGIKTSSDEIKLDNDSPDSGYNQKIENKLEKEKSIRESNEYESFMKICLDNANFFRERTPILSLTTELNVDNIDTIFDLLDDGSDELKNEFLNNLLIDDILLNKKSNN